MLEPVDDAERAVDAIADGSELAPWLDVDVRSTRGDTVADDQVGEFDDRSRGRVGFRDRLRFGYLLYQLDRVDVDAAVCRTKSDAPEIDGNLFIDEGFDQLNPGDIVTVTVDEFGEYDLWGQLK